MSKASEALATRAARTAARPTGTATAPAAAAAPVPRAQPVRFTIDLAPIAHQELLGVCRQAAQRLQLPKVPAASLVRALIVQLDQDPGLLERLLPDLRVDVEENRRRK